MSCVSKMQIIMLSHVEPIFNHHDAYLTTYDCYKQDLPVICYGDNVTMTANVSGNNLTLIWTVTTNDKTEVIDKHSDHYVLEDQNKVTCNCINVYNYC